MKPIAPIAVVLILLAALVDLNTATLAELDRLPGIGPVIAGRILEFREKRGGFRRVEELLAIQGISERMWLELGDRVRVGESPSHGAPDSEPDIAEGGPATESRRPEAESEDARERPPDAADGPAQDRAR